MTSEQNLKSQVRKQSFERNANRKDGLLLQVHHTLPGSTGEFRRTRFVLATFNPCDELLAVADHRGSIFIIDLANNLFWQLLKMVSVSVLAFHSHKKDELLIGHSGSHLSLLDSSTGAQIGSLDGHTKAPFQLSFSSDGHYGLSVASGEGFIWNLNNLTQAHRLNLQPGMTIKLAMFVPESDNILACFQDDAIHVWAFESFVCIKQIVPDSWKGNSICSIAFTRNGRAMVVGGLSKQIVIFFVDDWSTQRTLMLPDSVSSVRHLEFVPEAFDCGANKILAVLTDTGSLLFIDVNLESLIENEIQKHISMFTCSKAGKYIACNMSSGVVKIFSSSKLLGTCCDGENLPAHRGTTIPNSQAHSYNEGPSPPTKDTTAFRAKKHRIKKKLSTIDIMPQVNLDINRLRPILREFLMYPEQYRSIIWRSILQLPGNRGPWESLAKRPLHPSATKIAKAHSIQNKTALSCLQSVVSCLAYWSPVFGELPYLPHLIFPFVKVFHSDKFVCFEVIATVIVNWCQHWFEYLSFPPINILGMIENILSEHDTGLLSIFCKSGITSRQYAWSLLSTVFSEVLTSSQWLQLWDHVLSNSPWFLLFAVAAYNICCRASLKTCVSKDDFEFFFHRQNPINMKQFLKKCYELMEKTSNVNHPKEYFKNFQPLPAGNYPVFSAYPKFIVDLQKERRNAIRQEEEKILKEQHDIVSQSLAREELRLRESKARLHDARLIEAEKAAVAALNVEETRVAERKRQLLSLQRDLRFQERDSISKARVDIMEHEAKQRCAELERLHQELHNKAEETAITAQTMNAEWQEHFNRLAAMKQELQQKLSGRQLNRSAQALADSVLNHSNLSDLKEQQQHLRDTIKKKCRERISKPIPDHHNVNTRLAELDNLKQRVEVALAQKAQQQQDVIFEAEQCIEEANKEAKLEQLSDEVEQLMERLTATVLESGTYSRTDGYTQGNDPHLFSGSTTPGLTKSIDGVSISQRSHLYEKERSAVSSAMELRKSLLSNWNWNSH